MTERVRPGDAALARAGVDEHLDAMRKAHKAPRRARRAVAKAGGATLTPEQRRWGARAARSIARGEAPADITKPSRGAKVLRGQRGKPRPW